MLCISRKGVRISVSELPVPSTDLPPFLFGDTVQSIVRTRTYEDGYEYIGDDPYSDCIKCPPPPSLVLQYPVSSSGDQYGTSIRTSTRTSTVYSYSSYRVRLYGSICCTSTSNSSRRASIYRNEQKTTSTTTTTTTRCFGVCIYIYIYIYIYELRGGLMRYGSRDSMISDFTFYI